MENNSATGHKNIFPLLDTCTLCLLYYNIGIHCFFCPQNVFIVMSCSQVNLHSLMADLILTFGQHVLFRNILDCFCLHLCMRTKHNNLN